MRFLAGLVLVIGLGLSLAPHAPSAAFLLPEDPEAVVITLSHLGGGPTIPMGPMLPRNRRPLLSIRASGRSTVHASRWRSGMVEARIGAEEVRDLLRFAIAEGRFFRYDPGRLMAAVRREEEAKRFFGAADFPTVCIRITTADRDREARIPPTSPAVEQPWPNDPDLAILPHLNALTFRLLRVMARISAGGDAAVASAARLANGPLSRRFPGGPPLTSEHLSSAQRWADGGSEITFFRPDPGSPAEKLFRPGVHVGIKTPAIGPPSVTIQEGVR